MSLYQVNRVLWEVAKQPDVTARYQADPASVLAGRDLEPAEHAALERGEIRAIFDLGAHPFLLYNFALRRNGRFTMEFLADYAGQLEGAKLVDITT